MRSIRLTLSILAFMFASSVIAIDLRGVVTLTSQVNSQTSSTYTTHCVTLRTDEGRIYVLTLNEFSQTSSEFYPGAVHHLINRRVVFSGDSRIEHVAWMGRMSVIDHTAVSVLEEPSLKGKIDKTRILTQDGRAISLKPGKFTNLGSLHRKTCIVLGEFDSNNDYYVDGVSGCRRFSR